MVKPIPDGYQAVVPFLAVKSGVAQIEFLKEAFDATETFRMAGPDGAIHHAELRIRDSVIMIGQSPTPRPSTLHLYVPDVDAAYEKAMSARGAKSVREPSDQFYGDRSAGVEDSEGNQWWLATRIEDVSMEELEKRAAKAK
jgi:PhnB protein